MSKNKKIWLSATSTGESNQLDHIISILNNLDYEVINSLERINSKQDNYNLEKHLKSVAECDLFLGIINPKFINTEPLGDNIFKKEFKKAEECKIPYWYLVHRDVTFVRSIFKKLSCSEAKEVELKDNKIFDKETLKVYNYVINNFIRKPNGSSDDVKPFCFLNELSKGIDSKYNEPGSKKKLMLGSTVYGFEDQLSKIIEELISKDYQVLSSHHGTIKVNPKSSNLNNSLNAVEECELFLGIIRPYYGTGNINGKNITFEEIKKAIKLNRPARFFVHKNVEYAEKLFKKISCSADNKPELIDNKLFDKRSIELYDLVIKDNIKDIELREGNWAQEYYDVNDMMNYIITQFSDKEFISNILKQKESKDGK